MNSGIVKCPSCGDEIHRGNESNFINNCVILYGFFNVKDNNKIHDFKY